MLAGLRFLVREASRLLLALNASFHTRTGRFCVPVICQQTKGVLYALVRVLVLDQVLDRDLDPGAVRRASAASTGGGTSYPGGLSLAHRLVCAGPSSPRGTATRACP